MGRTSSNHIALLVFCFLFLASLKSYAQIGPTVKLAEYLLELEQEYDVKFSYRPEDIEGQNLSFNDQLEGLGAHLDYVQ